MVAVQGRPGEEQESRFELYKSHCVSVCSDVTQSISQNFDFSWPSEVELVSNLTTWGK